MPHKVYTGAFTPGSAMVARVRKAWLERLSQLRLATSDFLSQSATMVIAGGLAALISMAYASLCARWLSPAGYGDLGAALSLAYVLAIFLGPIETSVAKAAAELHGRGERGRMRHLLERALLWTLQVASVGALLCGAVLFAARGWLKLHVAAVPAFSIYLLLLFVMSVPRAVLRGDHRFVAYGINQIAEAAVRLIAGLVLIALHAGPTGALLGYGCGAAVAIVLGRAQLSDLPRSTAQSHFQPQSQAGVVFLVYFYFLYVANVDVLSAKHFLDADQAGFYASASTLTRMLSVVSTPIYQVLFSRITAHHAAGTQQASLGPRAWLLLAIALLFTCSIPFVMGDWTLALLFGKIFVPATPAMQLLWLSTVSTGVQAAIAFMLIGLNRTRGLALLLVPCALQAILLTLSHATIRDVALDSLIATSLGMLILAALWLTRGTER